MHIGLYWITLRLVRVLCSTVLLISFCLLCIFVTDSCIVRIVTAKRTLCVHEFLYFIFDFYNFIILYWLPYWRNKRWWWWWWCMMTLHIVDVRLTCLINITYLLTYLYCRASVCCNEIIYLNRRCDLSPLALHVYHDYAAFTRCSDKIWLQADRTADRRMWEEWMSVFVH